MVVIVMVVAVVSACLAIMISEGDYGIGIGIGFCIGLPSIGCSGYCVRVDPSLYTPLSTPTPSPVAYTSDTIPHT